MTLKAFIVPHLNVFVRGYVVSVVANTRERGMLRQQNIPIDVDYAPIERSIRPLADFVALLRLYRLFRQQRPDAVHSVTPKAGLLTMLAGWLARVPVRVHIFTGQIWATQSGFSRFVLKSADGVLAKLATHILVDSPSQRDFLVAEKITKNELSEVLAQGSICGVNLRRFRPDMQARDVVRRELVIPNDAVVFLYLGRLNRDKGIVDLATAFANIAQGRSDVWLLLVGPDEENMQSRVQAICQDCLEQIRIVGHTNDPARYMASADVFCLPSYREGFGSSVIEAAACGLPAIASKIYGLTDAVQDGITGLLHPPGDVLALAEFMRYLAEGQALRLSLGNAARKRAEHEFNEDRLTGAMIEFYRKVLGEGRQ